MNEDFVCSKPDINGNSISDECLRLIFINRHCSDSAISYAQHLKNKSIDFVRNWIIEKRDNSRYNVYSSEGLNRVLCFGITSLNTYNILYKAVVESIPTPSNILNNPNLITDGVRFDTTEDYSCFRQSSGNRSLKITLTNEKLIRKLVIYRGEKVASKIE